MRGLGAVPLAGDGTVQFVDSRRAPGNLLLDARLRLNGGVHGRVVT
jgi:hypothetical protein